MERFYFDLVNGSQSIPDEEGVEASDVVEAVSQAGEALAAMRERGELPEAVGWTFVVRDASGAVRHRLDLQRSPRSVRRHTGVPSAPFG